MKSIKKETNPMVLVKNNNKILNEVNIMKRMSHVHVLKMIDFYETPERVIIVMDFMEGTIISFIINNMYYKLSPKVVICWIASHNMIRIADIWLKRTLDFSFCKHVVVWNISMIRSLLIAT